MMRYLPSASSLSGLHFLWFAAMFGCAGQTTSPEVLQAARPPSKAASSADCVTAMAVGYMRVPPNNPIHQGGFNVKVAAGRNIHAFTNSPAATGASLLLSLYP